jgi:hypothetical protein
MKLIKDFKIESKRLFNECYSNKEEDIFFRSLIQEKIYDRTNIFYRGYPYKSISPPRFENFTTKKFDNKIDSNIEMIHFTSNIEYAGAYALDDYIKDYGWVIEIKTDNVNIFDCSDDEEFNEFWKGLGETLRNKVLKKIEVNKNKLKNKDTGIMNVFKLNDWYQIFGPTLRKDIFKSLYDNQIFQGYRNYEHGMYLSLGIFSDSLNNEYDEYNSYLVMNNRNDEGIPQKPFMEKYGTDDFYKLQEKVKNTSQYKCQKRDFISRLDDFMK